MKDKALSVTRQKGVVLIVSMVMLLLLTLIGVTGSQVTSLEERMAGNVRDQNIAFQAAEATLLAAEQFILATDPGPLTYSEVAGSSAGRNGLLGQGVGTPSSIPEPNFFAAATWIGTNSATTPVNFGADFKNKLNIAIADPRYIIKKIASLPGPINVFRITARAVGQNPGTQVILQEVFERTN